jgi:hypothetical protein
MNWGFVSCDLEEATLEEWGGVGWVENGGAVAFDGHIDLLRS